MSIPGSDPPHLHRLWRSSSIILLCFAEEDKRSSDVSEACSGFLETNHHFLLLCAGDSGGSKPESSGEAQNTTKMPEERFY